MKMIKKIFILISIIAIVIFNTPFKTSAAISNIQFTIDNTRNTIIYFTFNPRFLREDLTNNGGLVAFGQESNIILKYEHTTADIWNIYDLNGVLIGSGSAAQLNRNMMALVFKKTTTDWQYGVYSWRNADGVFAWQELTNTSFSTSYTNNIIYFSSFCSIFAVDYYDTGASFLDFVIYHWTNVINDNLNGLGNLVLSQGAYQAAYEEGYSAGFGAQGSFLASLWNALDAFLAINILPNISIGLIVSVPIALGLISLILNFWRKD